MKIYLRVKTYALICAAAVMGLTSCEKGDVGEQGPAGLQGPTGPQGIQGIAGVAGLNGKTMLSGSAAPIASVGTEGDFYLDLSTSELYGPKTSTGWGLPISIKGMNGQNGKDGINGTNGVDGKDGKDGINGTNGADGKDGINGTNGIDGKDGINGTNGIDGKDGINGTNGIDGKDGSKLLGGFGKPDATVGADGDYYIDKQTAEMYGPKNSEGWGAAVSLKVSSGVQTYFIRGHKFNSIISHNNPNVEAYSIESQINLGRKFEELGDENVVLYYLKVPNMPTATWHSITDNWGYGVILLGSHKMSVAETPTFYLYDNWISGETINISGDTYSISRKFLEENGIDVRIVVLSSASAELLASRKIDTKNLVAVQQALNIK